jgi:hypothetical protein
MLPVVALLLAPIREVVEARPVTGPLTLAPIVGLRFGFLLYGRFRRERVEGGTLVRLRGKVVGRIDADPIVRRFDVGGDFVDGVFVVVHIFRILGVESFGKKFFYALKTIRIKRAMARHPHKMRGSTSMMAVSFFMRLIYQRLSDCQEIF